MNRFLKAIFTQIVGTQKNSLFVFTKHAKRRMVEYRVTEKQVTEVFYKGSHLKEGMMSREYNGYQIGIVFKHDVEKREIVIISCWRQKNW
jgi:hypothetical protein